MVLAEGALRFGSPRQVYHVSDWLLWFVIWLLPFAIWLPVASTVAAAGWKIKRMARSLRVLKRPVYWLWWLCCSLIGAYLPYKLVWWIPDLSTFANRHGVRDSVSLWLMCFLISAWVALLLVIGERVEKEDPDPIVSATEPASSDRP